MNLCSPCLGKLACGYCVGNTQCFSFIQNDDYYDSKDQISLNIEIYIFNIEKSKFFLFLKGISNVLCIKTCVGSRIIFINFRGTTMTFTIYLVPMFKCTI